MPRRIPTLSALSAFEAAARHLSFKKAAEELCVTPSSVSHQIKALEEQLGVLLFVRFNREVALTQDGVHYFAVVSEALADIETATSTIARNQDSRPSKRRLVVSANSGFVDCWLSSRLSAFGECDPETELEVYYGEDLADYRHRDADVAIHFSSSGPPGGDTMPLYRAMEFPVCSPDLRLNGAPLTKISDLAKVTLLHERDHFGWQRWLKTAGAPDIDASGGPIFQNTQTIFSRVKACEGVAMADDFVGYDDLLAGNLIKPFPVVRESDWSLYLIQLRRDRSPEAVDSFCSWLTRTIEAFRISSACVRDARPYPEDWPGET